MDLDTVVREINAARVVVYQKRMENTAPISASAILDILTTNHKEA